MQGFPRDPGMLFGGSSAPTTGRVLSRADVLASDPRAVLGDTAYAEVNSKWLPRFYDCFRAELFGNGISKWDARFTCRHFASYYAALAQARFYRETFRDLDEIVRRLAGVSIGEEPETAAERVGEEILSMVAEGTAEEILIHAKEFIKVKERLNRILIKHTGHPLEKIEQDTDRDRFMSAEEALEYGLIDHVIEHAGQT